MTLKKILLHSHVIHVHVGLTNALSCGVTRKSNLLEIQMKEN